MKLSVKTTVFFTFPLRHSFFGQTTVFFTGKNYGIFYKEKTTVIFTGKNYGIFYREKTTVIFTGKNYGIFYREKLRSFLQRKHVF